MASFDFDSFKEKAKGYLTEEKLRELAKKLDLEKKFDVDGAIGAAAEKAFGGSPEALNAVMHSNPLQNALISLKFDTESILTAISEETDPKKLAGLQEDLLQILPARQAHVNSLIASQTAGKIQEQLKEGLGVLVQVAKVVAMAFIAK